MLNLVVVVDREWRRDPEPARARGRYHPSRTILCAVEPRRTTIDATVALTNQDDNLGDGISLTRERIVLDLGERHLAKLDTIVDPLVVTDIATLVYAARASRGARRALHLSQVVLIDSVNEPDFATAVARARELAEAYVVDLAWLRGTPWRERVASTFDPPQWREELGRIDKVTVHHRPDSAIAGVLFLLARLAARLGDGFADAGERRVARQGARPTPGRGLHAVPDEGQSVPGLAGVEIGTASGMRIGLDRGPAGLAAHRTDRRGNEST